MEEARHINWLLRLLKSKEEDFKSCMHLTIVCYRKLRRYGHLDWGYRLHQKWRDIAMQNAAHSIYHSGYILSGILKSVTICPTLKQRLDIQKLHTAQPTFKKYFPQSDRLRHAVAHSAEAVHTRADLAQE